MKIITVFLAIILVLGGILGCSCQKENGAEQIGTIRLPVNDSNTSVIFTHPPELTGKWEKPTLSSVNIELYGQITNISGQSVSFETHFLFDGEEVDANPWMLGPVGPGKTIEIKRNIAINEGWDKKVLEIRLVARTLTTSSTTAPTTKTPTATTAETKIFTSAPKNPQTPQELTAALYFYTYTGETQGAIALIEKEKPDLISYKEVEAIMKGAPRGLNSVKIDDVSINADYATVEVTIDVRGTIEKGHRVNLVRENGVWRVSLNNFP